MVQSLVSYSVKRASRSQKLSPQQKSELARDAAQARWAGRPTIVEAVRDMIGRITQEAKKFVLFFEDGEARFCDAKSIQAAQWIHLNPEYFVGTYGEGATFTSVMEDIRAM